MNLRTAIVLLGAAVIAGLSARPYVGGWNDGSRLASVECLVDHATWTIDQSRFVDSPDGGGTKDKLLIGGKFYSDKSPVPALLMAGEYALIKSITGWTFANRPSIVCEMLCLATAGLAYILAVWSIDRLGRLVGLSTWASLGLTASFALATVAPVYARHVNNHSLLLAVTAMLLFELTRLSRTAAIDRSTFRLLAAGSLAGLAYTIDLGAGPVITLGAAAMVAYRRRMRGLIPFAAAVAPWLLLHHGLNFAIGGTLGPANAHLEYLDWPGSPFNASNATGAWAHPTMFHFFVYAFTLLFGIKGFLIHNLPLLLAVPAAVWLIRRRVYEAPEIAMAGAWAIGVWLIYAVASNNSGGQCCSIRWFVPLLAPGYLILAVLLRERPRFGIDFFVLSAWGAAMTLVMWQAGPWMPRLVTYWWAFLIGAITTWSLAVRRRLPERQPDVPDIAQFRFTLRQRFDQTSFAESTPTKPDRFPGGWRTRATPASAVPVARPIPRQRTVP
jgi:hypothetical protein